VSDFAQPVLARGQFVLIPTTLDDAIPDAHEVRLLDEILRTQDWSSWEAVYSLRRGQPPIPPRVIASVILYGLLRRIRSSRVLEYMTGHNVDFIRKGATLPTTPPRPRSTPIAISLWTRMFLRMPMRTPRWRPWSIACRKALASVPRQSWQTA